MTEKMVSCDASAHAAAIDSSFLVSFILLAVVVIVAADRVLLWLLLLVVVSLFAKSAWLCLSIGLFLLFFTLQLLGPLLLDLLLRVLIQIDIKISFAFKRLVRVRNKLWLFLYFPNFFKIALQIFACSSSIDPLLGLLSDLLDDIKLDDFSNVGAVVGALKDCELRVVLQLKIVKQLQPQVFKLIRVVFK